MENTHRKKRKEMTKTPLEISSVVGKNPEKSINKKKLLMKMWKIINQ